MNSSYFLLIICSLLYHEHSLTQNTTLDSLPPLKTLEASIIAYSTAECQAQLTAYETSKPKAWKELLPSIGLGYTVVGSLRPSVMWSPSQILDRKDTYNRNKNQKKSLELSCDLILSDRLHKLRQLYHNYMVDERILESRRATLLIDEELFAITERKYQEHLIKPSEYLAAKRTILKARSDVEVMGLELEKLGYELMYMGRS